jgi:uncharacterized protein YydD (DUF2326 family)
MHTFYNESLREGQPADNRKVTRVYAEAGVALPELVIKRLEDVQAFHRQVVANRRNFLQAEIALLSRTMAERNEQIRVLTEEQAAFLGVLQTHGALAEHSELQRLHNEDQTQLQRVL